VAEIEVSAARDDGQGGRGEWVLRAPGHRALVAP
jgi:hypothetical protein